MVKQFHILNFAQFLCLPGIPMSACFFYWYFGSNLFTGSGGMSVIICDALIPSDSRAFCDIGGQHLTE